MRVLITGAGGQLGRDLQLALATHNTLPLTHAQLDITDGRACIEATSSFRPDAVIHAAALTDTTRCEREPGVALAVNGEGARNVAAACSAGGAAMVYVSTNEVFDGAKSAPYAEDDATGPLNAYGRSKREGERLVREALPESYIVRTAWLYGRDGNNFVSKILRAADAGAVSGVSDEIATPTWTRDLANAIAQLIETGSFGVYHLTNSGEASRLEWAEQTLRLAGNDLDVRAVTSDEFRASLPADTVAPEKPRYSALANNAGTALGIELRPWRDALAEFLKT